MSARSFLPLGLMPATTPPARMPGTAVMPPSSHSMLGASRLQGYTGRRLEARSARSSRTCTLRFCTPLAEPPLPRLSIADTHTAPAGPRVRHHGDVAVVRADDGAGRRALALVEHAHERLARVELSIDVQQPPPSSCAAASGTDAVVKSPRLSGTRWGVKATRSGAPASAAQLLLDLRACAGGRRCPYACTFSLASV